MSNGVTDLLKKGYESINPAALIARGAKSATKSLMPDIPKPVVQDPMARQTQGIGEMTSLLDRTGMRKARKLQDSSMTIGRKPLGGK